MQHKKIIIIEEPQEKNKIKRYYFSVALNVLPVKFILHERSKLIQALIKTLKYL